MQPLPAPGLEKELGQTIVTSQGMLDEPIWRWPDMNKVTLRFHSVLMCQCSQCQFIA